MFDIDDISQNHAVIFCNIKGEHIFAQISLDYECERMRGDDFCHEYFWDEYTPVIKNIHGLDDDGEPYLLSSEVVEVIKQMLDCDKFYTAYQERFDDNFEYGKDVSRYYYTA